MGCYGQKRIRTPRIDGLAREGLRFTALYSGSPVCAPSRCTLLTGKHTGHAFIRNNGRYRKAPEGQRPLPAGTATLARVLKAAGYAPAAWGNGGSAIPDPRGIP